MITDSVITRNTLDGIIASADTGQTAQLTVSHSLVASNGAAGVNATSFGGGAVVHAAVVGSTLTDNATGAIATATTPST
jgi:hypothetical protein